MDIDKLDAIEYSFMPDSEGKDSFSTLKTMSKLLKNNPYTNKLVEELENMGIGVDMGGDRAANPKSSPEVIVKKAKVYMQLRLECPYCNKEHTTRVRLEDKDEYKYTCVHCKGVSVLKV